jgi:hypothetical protein
LSIYPFFKGTNGLLVPARVPAAAPIARVDVCVYAQTVLVLVLALLACRVVRDTAVAAPSPLRVRAGVALLPAWLAALGVGADAAVVLCETGGLAALADGCLLVR